MISFSSFVEYMVGNCLLFHLPPPLTSVERAVVVSAEQWSILNKVQLFDYATHELQSVVFWRSPVHTAWWPECVHLTLLVVCWGNDTKLPDFCSVFWPSGDRWGKGVSMVSLASCNTFSHLTLLGRERGSCIYVPHGCFTTPTSALLELPSLVNMSSASSSNILFARWVFSR